MSKRRRFSFLIAAVLLALSTFTVSAFPIINFSSYIEKVFVAFHDDRTADDKSSQLGAGSVLIYEVEADAPISGTDSAHEWIELKNVGGGSITLSGWSIVDNAGSDLIPEVTLGPGGSVILAGSSAQFMANHSGFTGTVLDLGGVIGSGLANGGDVIFLRDSANTTIDCMSYGSNVSCLNPAVPGTPGDSNVTLQRSSDTDTDAAGDWMAAIESPNGTTLNEPGTIQFSSATYSGAENGGTITITATRAGGFSGAASADFSFTDQTATGAASCVGSADYVNTGGTFSWADGDAANKTYDIPICNDGVFKGDEIFTASLTNFTGAGEGSPSTANITITNDDIQSFTLTVVKSGSGSGTITSVDGGINCGVDCSEMYLVGTVVTLSAAPAPGSAFVGWSGGGCSGTGQCTITIGGDATVTANFTMPGTLVLSSATYSVSEGTASATITAIRTGGASGTVAVGYATSNGTASGGGSCAPGVDYVAASGGLTWVNGEIGPKTFTVPICNDATFEGDETVNVTLSSPSGGATLGSPSSAVLTIVDNDSAPAPIIQVTDVNFVFVTAGTTSVQNATITNTGTANLVIGTVALSGTNASAFSLVTSPDGAVIAPGANIQFQIRFSPPVGSTGLMTADYVVSSNAISGDNQGFLQGTVTAPEINVTGNGMTIVDGDVTPSPADNTDFGLTVSGTPVLRTFVIANAGTSTLFVSGVSISNVTGGGSFTASPVTNPTISPGGNASFTVSFNPVSPGLKTATVNIISNDSDESPYDFAIQGTGDNAGTFVLSSATYSVGESGGVATITVNRTGGASGAVSVNFGTSDGTATGGLFSCTPSADYRATSGTLGWASGETVPKTFTIPICADTLDETDETVNITLSSPTGGAVLGTPSTAVLTITDDDATPTVSINDVAIAEGAGGGSSNLTFTITQSAVSGLATSVNWSTADGTATTSDNDYTGANGTATIPAGSISVQVSISIVGDNKFENNETLFVNLSNPTNVAINDGQGQGTINNDDPLPSISIGDVTAVEGNSGNTSFVFPLVLSAASSQNVTVSFETSGMTATPGSDYIEQMGSVVIPAGQVTGQISVTVLGDTILENNETFSVGIFPVNATVLDNFAIGTITNDDATPSLSITDVNMNEGNSGTTNFVFNVSLSAPSGTLTTVNWATANGTAIAPGDYIAASGVLSIAPGAGGGTIVIAVNGDTSVEGFETFFVNLSSPVNATIDDGQGTGVIANDDVIPTFFVVNTTADEADGTCADADCSLRDAVFLASGDTTITFSALFNTPQTIALTLGNLVLNQKITISGPGAHLLTIQDNNPIPGPAFAISGGSNVIISGMTITGANGGGQGAAVSSIDATLRLDGVHITGNTSVGNYGGVYADGGTTYIVNSTFSGNTTPSGSCAAFAQQGGNAYIANSTFSGNSGSSTGIGGAICGAFTSLWLRNVTIAGNSSGTGGGVYYEGSSAPELHIANSIIAGNSSLMPGAGGHEICLSTSANVTSEGNNLIGDSPFDSGGCDVFGINYLASDIRDTDPLLGPLQNNGGTTPTRALLTGSPAIDAGNNAQAIIPGPSPVTLISDQRGMQRIVDGNVDGTATVDIGAYEKQLAPTAANVTLSGRVLTASGIGIRNARVILTGGNLETPIITQTGSFGEFRVELTAGETYIVTVSADRYHIPEPMRVVTMLDDVSGYDFTGYREE